MANRYWVGGTDTWNSTAGTKWSTTSGGPGGASVPTVADDVFFDSSSTGTVTLSTSTTAKTLNFTGFTGTITGTSAFTVAGSLTLGSGMTWSSTGTITITGTGTITTAGKTLTGNLIINAPGATVSLGDNLSMPNYNLTLSAGTFTTTASNYSINVNVFSCSVGTTAATLSLNGSTVTVNSTGSGFILSGTGLTFNAGTSTIILTGNGGLISLSSQLYTLNNVTFTPGSTGICTISSDRNGQTYNNITITPALNGCAQLVLTHNLTVTGTFTVSSSSITQRAFIRPSTATSSGITITAAAMNASNGDFRGITISGAAAPYSPSNGGDCGGNSGITFPAAKTVYWNFSGTRNWSDNGWASTSGGTPSLSNFPLPQDTAVFDNTGAAGTISIFNFYNIGSIDCSARTSAVTLSFTSDTRIYKDVILGSGVTLSGNGTLAFFNWGTTLNITSVGKNFPYRLVFAATSGGTVRLVDNLSSTGSSAGDCDIVFGTLDLNNNTFSTPAVSLNSFYFNSSTGTRSIAFGTSGQITLTGSNKTLFFQSDSTNFTFTGTSNFVCNSAASSGTRTLYNVSSSESQSMSFSITAGTDTINTTSTSFYRNLNFTGFAGTLTNAARTIYGNLIFSPSMTFASGANVTTFAATSGTQDITPNGTTQDFPITILAPGATVRLLGDLSIGSSRTLTITRGTFNANGYNVTAGSVSSNVTTNTRTITMGSGIWTLSGTGYVWELNATNLTFNKDTADIVLSSTASSLRYFSGASLTYNNLVIGGSTGNSTTQFIGSNTFNAISSTKTVAHTILFSSGTNTTVSNWTVTGSAGNVVTLGPVSGVAYTLTKSGGGTISVDYMSISYSNASPASTWYAGVTSTDAGNNTGWIFSSPPTPGGAGSMFFMFN